MTTPDLSSIIPLKWKTWVGLVGAVLTFVVPLILSVEDYLPSPWPAVIGGALSVLTALGIYKAPYKPTGTVLVPERPAGIPGATGTVLDGDLNLPPWAGTVTVRREGGGGNGAGGTYTNPWQ